MPGIQWFNTAVETLVSRDPGYFHGCVVLASSGGGRATFYDGTDATTGRKILQVKGQANHSKAIHFGKPLFCSRGLFVADLSHLDDLLVLWEPVAE